VHCFAREPMMLLRWPCLSFLIFKIFMNIFLSEKLVNVLNTQILHIFLKCLQKSVKYMYFIRFENWISANDLFI
jgi:hypothetical protein